MLPFLISSLYLSKSFSEYFCALCTDLCIMQLLFDQVMNHRNGFYTVVSSLSPHEGYK